MFEIPEYVTLTHQINKSLSGKQISRGLLGNSPHKFVWYNSAPEEFDALTRGKIIGKASTRGRWLFIALENDPPTTPEYLLAFGECGGKMLLHPPESMTPPKYHLKLDFLDGSSLTETTQMWGAMELYEKGLELERVYIKGMKITPVESAFTQDYFSSLIDQLLPEGKRSVKALLTQDQLIPGLGNAIAQDILFNACLHPRHLINVLEPSQRQDLFQAIQVTLQEAIDKGGRHDETDLYGQPGGYVRLMDNKAVGKACPRCGGLVEKFQFLGGSNYACSNCQK